jgi:hypothetical protein
MTGCSRADKARRGAGGKAGQGMGTGGERDPAGQLGTASLGLGRALGSTWLLWILGGSPSRRRASCWPEHPSGRRACRCRVGTSDGEAADVTSVLDSWCDHQEAMLQFYLRHQDCCVWMPSRLAPAGPPLPGCRGQATSR